jgi:hypothetical protein
MPVCPSCEFEYRSGTRTCPDCGVELVDHLPPLGASPLRYEDTSQVLLCTVAGEIHAKLVQDALAAQGIRCRTQRRGLVHWLGLPTVGGDEPTQIYVNSSDLALARSLLEDFEGIGSQQVDWELPPDESPDPDE